MKLKRYLRTNEISQYAFAKQLEVSRSVLSYYCRDLRYPKPDILERISRLTGGAVSGKDFVTAESRRVKNGNG